MNYKLSQDEIAGIFGTFEKYEEVIDQMASANKNWKKMIINDRELDRTNPVRQRYSESEKDRTWKLFYEITSGLMRDWCEGEFVPLGEHEQELMPKIIEDIWTKMNEKY